MCFIFYNYFIKNGQTYYVSCITSPNENDQTSIGFVTINLKDKSKDIEANINFNNNYN